MFRSCPLFDLFVQKVFHTKRMAENPIQCVWERYQNHRFINSLKTKTRTHNTVTVRWNRVKAVKINPKTTNKEYS